MSFIGRLCQRARSLETALFDRSHHFLVSCSHPYLALLHPACDGQTNRQTEGQTAGHIIHCASTALHGNKPLTRHTASTQHSLTFRVRRYVVITAKPVHRLQIRPTEGIPYHSPKLHPGPCSSVGMRRGTDRQTHRHA